MTRSVLDDLFAYNDWVHGRIFAMCQGLTDSQLDQSREMGFGSLRGTLFHILTAEQIWLERWEQIPWRVFPTDPHGMPISEIADGLARCAKQRRSLMDAERGSGFRRVVNYRDSKGNPYSNHLEDLLLHVANHGIHHRAQALSFLKAFGRTVPGGLDYIFYRLARPSIVQDESTLNAFRSFGLEINSAPGESVSWDGPLLARYFAYSDWANERLMGLAESLSEESLDRSIDMGMGTIRKSFLHMYDAERWWWKNWHDEAARYEHSPNEIKLDELRGLWTGLSRKRNEFVAGLSLEQAQRVVLAVAGGPPCRFSIVESVIQLCGHGTHHRAQISNMLRQCSVQPTATDFIVWLRS